jgi:site-specific DNA recombinase
MKCEKCNYESEEKDSFQKKFGLDFCNVCSVFAPNNPEELDKYIEKPLSKEEAEVLAHFRSYANIRSKNLKQGMIKKAIKGNSMSRAPFGYKIENKKLIPAQNFKEIEEIFEEFLNENISLRKLAAKHNLSVNGLKKILKNFTYLGKIKFNNQIYEGNHQPIISSTLFNHVQNKLERLGIK